jgi:hypothetical protein
MRALTVTGAVAFVALAAACGQSVDHVAGPAGPVVAGSSAPASPSAPATSTAPSTPASAKTSTTPSKATRTATDPCPVSASTLYSALRHSDIYERAGKPDGMAKPSCYQGYAYGRSTFDKPQNHDGEIAWVLFKYDHSWKAINLGTGDVCAAYISSQAVRDRLNQGTGGGC